MRYNTLKFLPYKILKYLFFLLSVTVFQKYDILLPATSCVCFYYYLASNQSIGDGKRIIIE